MNPGTKCILCLNWTLDSCNRLLYSVGNHWRSIVEYEATAVERQVITRDVNEILNIFLYKWVRGVQYLAEYVQLDNVLRNIYDIDLMNLDLSQVEVGKIHIAYDNYVKVHLKVKGTVFFMHLIYPENGFDLNLNFVKDNGLGPKIQFNDRKYKKGNILLDMTDDYLDVYVKNYASKFLQKTKDMAYLVDLKTSLG